MLRSIKDASVAGKKVLLRSGLNVPIENGVVANEFRLLKALQTIEYLRAKGARTIIIGHIGRDASESLAPVAEALKKHLPLTFLSSVMGDTVKEAVDAMHDGDIVMLENLRSHDGEKNNDSTFVQGLADLADIYVDDAFSVMHREHASIVGVPNFLPGYTGLLSGAEIEHLAKALTPEHPSLFILGGAKFDTKLPVLRMSIASYDTVFIAGALANDFLKAKGYEVGTSLTSDNASGIDDLLHDEKVIIPVDVVVQNKEGEKAIRSADAVHKDESILDIGPESTRMLADVVKQASFVVWNGPLGFYEGGFGGATEAIAEIIAAHECTSLVGGGDTIAAIAKLGIEDSFTWLSTGGGAMLDYLADGKLPGIEALEQSPHFES